MRRLARDSLFSTEAAAEHMARNEVPEGPCYILGMEDYAERIQRLDPDGSKSYRLLLIIEGKTEAEIAAAMARMYPTSH